MQNSNKILQALGIPFTALLSVIFGLLLVSFPIGIFVVFESEIGGDINYEYPLTHLELLMGQNCIKLQLMSVLVMCLLYCGLFTL